MAWQLGSGFASSLQSGTGKLAGDVYGKGLDLGERWLNSQQSFAWNGKDLHRNIRYQKRMIRFQNEQSKALSLWSAKEMPSATMAGLKAAGLNPLLTAGGSTNVAPMVASSAASVPYSESYVPNNSSSTDGKAIADLFTGNVQSAKQAQKDVDRTTSETAQANRAEQQARREFFESPEGKKAVRDRLRMDYGPQSAMQAAVLGAHSAGDAANAISRANDLPKSEPTTNQWLAWWRDNGRGTSSRDSTINANRKRTWTRRDSHNKVDRSRHNEYHFHFGASAKTIDSGSRTNRPVWYNPDIKP